MSQDGPKHISDVLKQQKAGGLRLVPPPSRQKTADTHPSISTTTRRLLDGAAKISAGETGLVFQHSVLCQVSLPYRNPGDVLRTWDRKSGNTRLRINAGDAYCPEGDTYVELGLPHGVKPRIILAHLNTEALKQESPIVHVGDSMTAYAKRLGMDTNGPSLLKLQEQLARLSTATMRIAFANKDGHAIQFNTQIISAFDLWYPQDSRQRVLWSSVVELDHRYFESLSNHSIPLAEEAIASLSHNARALDIYCWLAQRLHRVDPNKPYLVPWPSLMHQFYQPRNPNQSMSRLLRSFRKLFRKDIRAALSQYPAARVEDQEDGLLLRNSPSPIPKKVYLVQKSVGK